MSIENKSEMNNQINNAEECQIVASNDDYDSDSSEDSLIIDLADENNLIIDLGNVPIVEGPKFKSIEIQTDDVKFDDNEESNISIQQESMLDYLKSLNVNSLDELKKLLNKKSGPIKQRGAKSVQQYIMDAVSTNTDKWFSKADIGEFIYDTDKNLKLNHKKNPKDEDGEHIGGYKSYRTYIHYLVRQEYLLIQTIGKNKKVYKFNKALDSNYSNKYCHKNPKYKNNNNN